MISVIIPTYKEPEVLDLCLRSAIEGQHNNNEIIVVVDGFYDINKEILEKYKDKINILDLKENQGLCRATNLGVYNASNELILVVNDDNIFPINWDEQLERVYQPNSVLTPNQIEPIPSMFRQFHIKDLGRDPNKFDLEAFWKYEIEIHENKIEETGSTLPFLINKNDYLRVGGWDESYPGAWVVDWEFFMKCEMNGIKMLRTYNCHFYHFVSLGTKTPERIADSQIKEQECHEYFYYKWGTYAKHNPENNSKLIF
jgi:glycosyltransferase involved in cell wall biosynthesis